MKHKYYDLIMAWANGFKIELQDIYTPDWHPIEYPAWDVTRNYRIAPQKITQTGWMNVYTWGTGSVYTTEEIALHKKNIQPV